MKKTLKELDSVYNSVTAYMSKEEKIRYCETLIKETEKFLGNTNRPLDLKVKEKYWEIVNAARREVDLLNEKDQEK